MKPIKDLPAQTRQQIHYVLTDIDDTLTLNGKLPAIAYTAMERLQLAGIKVIPITGRPAGWCDHIARMWPVDGLVGENGAFYFSYDSTAKQMIRRFQRSTEQRKEDQIRLAALQEQILREVPGCGLSVDQPYRMADLAIDFCEDVPRLPPDKIKKIIAIFEAAGAVAKISSIHVNGWFGDYNKLSMTKLFFSEIMQVDLESQQKETILFSGDSPNDAPMFSFFPQSVGVANILEFADDLPHKPTWITEHKGGYGFAEMADVLLENNSSTGY